MHKDLRDDVETARSRGGVRSDLPGTAPSSNSGMWERSVCKRGKETCEGDWAEFDGSRLFDPHLLVAGAMGVVYCHVTE